jgi:hypothetical protein
VLAIPTHNVTPRTENSFDAADEQPPSVPAPTDEDVDMGDLCEPPADWAAKWWWGLPVAALAGALGMYAWQRSRDKQRDKVLAEVVFARVASPRPGDGELPEPPLDLPQEPHRGQPAEVSIARGDRGRGNGDGPRPTAAVKRMRRLLFERGVGKWIR